jgi:hypothetical protein
MNTLEPVYQALDAYLRRQGYEVGGKLWRDGFGLVAAGADEAGQPHVVVSVSTADWTIMASQNTLVAALRSARYQLLTAPQPVPLDAARWLTTIIEQWETDHPADRPN